MSDNSITSNIISSIDLNSAFNSDFLRLQEATQNIRNSLIKIHNQFYRRRNGFASNNYNPNHN